MTTSPPPSRPQFRPGTSLGHVPTPFWVGLVIGVLTFFVHITSTTIASGSDGYSCSYNDFGALIGAVVVVICVGAGWAGRRNLHVARQLALPLMYGASAVLLALVAVHVLRGIGTIDSICDGHPQP